MKPKALVNVKTGGIISWGYSDFSYGVKAGEIEQVEVEDKPLPDERWFCRYNFDTKQIEKRTDTEIQTIKDGEKAVKDKEALIQNEMRQLAINSLESKGLL